MGDSRPTGDAGVLGGGGDERGDGDDWDDGVLEAEEDGGDEDGFEEVFEDVEASRRRVAEGWR